MHTLLLHYCLFILLFLLSRKKNWKYNWSHCLYFNKHSFRRQIIHKWSCAKSSKNFYHVFCPILHRDWNKYSNFRYLCRYLHCTSTDILVTFFTFFFPIKVRSNVAGKLLIPKLKVVPMQMLIAEFPIDLYQTLDLDTTFFYKGGGGFRKYLHRHLTSLLFSKVRIFK